MKQIPLTQDKFAIVDDEDYDFLMQWNWCLNKKYATRTVLISGKGKNRIRRNLAMHTVINKTPDGMDTDHIDGDGLNNQKYNLRSCTRSQNQMNKKSHKNSSSKYKGVLWRNQRNNWIANIFVKGKTIHLGSFPLDKEHEAAEAYNKAALKHFGEFAKMNTVD